MVTDAAAYEGARLREGLLYKTNIAALMWPDNAYRSAANEDFLVKNDFVSRIHRKKPPGKPYLRGAAGPMPRSRGCIPSIEHIFAAQKSRMGLFVRTIWIARATKIGMANLVYNLKRLIFLEKRAFA